MTRPAGDLGPAPRVLHVIEAFRGGTSRHVADIVSHAPGDHHIALPPGVDAPRSGAPFDRRALEAVERAGATVHHLGMDRRPWAPANLSALAALRRLVSAVGPDVLHGHSSVGGALARLAGALPRSPRVAYTANGIAVEGAYRRAERALGRWTDAWIAVSDSEAAEAVRHRLVRPGSLVVVPNGIDPLAAPAEPPADLRRQLGLLPGTPLVGTVARLVAQKSPSRFVEVCAEVAGRRPEAHFVLVGSGPLQAEVEAGVSRLGLGDRWHRLGELPGAEWAIGQFDVFVLASSFEGAPYTPLEAMRAGVPVVLSDVVGNRDVVVDGVSGVLRAPGDTEGMADAVVGFLADPARRAAVTAAARARLEERFDVRAMGAALGALYRRLAASRAPGSARPSRR